MGVSSIKVGDIVLCPVKTDSLTKNKEYAVKKVYSDTHFTIKDDDGNKLHCKLYQCGHIEEND